MDPRWFNYTTAPGSVNAGALKQNQMSGWFDIGAAGIGALGSLASRIGQKKRERRQVGYQKDLMGEQLRNQMMLNEQGQQLAMQTWYDTNAEAQVKQLEQAGLNPALMYQSGGPGGTTQGQPGGGAQAGDAPNVQNLPMDIGNLLQAVKTKAEIDLIKSQAEKNKTEAGSLRGEEGTVGASQIQSNLAEALNKEQLARVNELKGDILKASKDDQIEYYAERLENLIEDTDLKYDQRKKLKEEVATLKVQQDLMASQIGLNETQAWKLAQDVTLKAMELDIMGIGLQIENTKAQSMWANAMTNYRAQAIKLLEVELQNNREWQKLKQENAHFIIDRALKIIMPRLNAGGQRNPISFK